MLKIDLNVDLMKLWHESIERDCVVEIAWFCYDYRVGSSNVYAEKWKFVYCENALRGMGWI